MDTYCVNLLFVSIGRMAESENRKLTDKFMLRLPDGMRERIKSMAEKNNRSMNAEIVSALEEMYPEIDTESLGPLFCICLEDPSIKPAAEKALRDVAAEKGSDVAETADALIGSLETRETIKIFRLLRKLGDEVTDRALLLLIERGEMPKHLQSATGYSVSLAEWLGCSDNNSITELKKLLPNQRNT